MNTNKKQIYLFGGGTVEHITSHFSVSATAYGKTAEYLHYLIESDDRFNNMESNLILTKMAGGFSSLETNRELEQMIELINHSSLTKMVFFSCAVVDWQPFSIEGFKDDRSPETISGSFDTVYDFPSCEPILELGKYADRIESRDHDVVRVEFIPTTKMIKNIRRKRKDIFLAGFKTTCGATKQEMFEKGLRLCKEASANLVLVNDVRTRWNMIITPEEAAYHETQNREEALKQLVDMAYYRSQLTFTQSTVVDGQLISWDSPEIPESLRTVVNYCVKKNAYKPFKDATVGHFAHKLDDMTFLTSIRKSNFNKLNETGLVKVKTDGPDTVIAYGAKPSVGGQSQRTIFKDHAGMDCIVHFHCPLRPGIIDVPVKSQREVECGSHECGKNTSNGLSAFGNLKAVYLDKHGPNIVFNKNIDPHEVIGFIEHNFNLEEKTGGYNL